MMEKKQKKKKTGRIQEISTVLELTAVICLHTVLFDPQIEPY